MIALVFGVIFLCLINLNSWVLGVYLSLDETLQRFWYPRVETYLPIDLSAAESASEKKATSRKIDYIVEPSVEEFIAHLLPRVITLKMFTALLDSNASEHAARTVAMQIATDNANELIQDLTKQYNKSRQQAITNELLDIIGGSMK